jgi:hypothetical protein
MRRLGLLAGSGRYPLWLAREARRQGIVVAAVLIERAALPAVAQTASPCLWLPVGQLGRAVRFFEKHGASEVVLAGAVPRAPLVPTMRPDRHALRLLPHLFAGGDRLLRLIAAFFEAQGFAVVGPSELAAPLLPAPGRIGGPLLGPHAADAAAAWRAAERVGSRDRGQAAVCVGGKVVTEGPGGTDALLGRAARLRRGDRARRGVLAKVSKPRQDLRFDLPAIGPGTVAAVDRAGLAGIVVQARATLVLDREQTAALADARGIALVASLGPPEPT